MAVKRNVIRKRKGRPSIGAKAAAVVALRIPDELQARVEHYAAREPDAPAFSVALRRLIEAGLAKAGNAKK
jgi:hypothetical protein